MITIYSLVVCAKLDFSNTKGLSANIFIMCFATLTLVNRDPPVTMATYTQANDYTSCDSGRCELKRLII